MDINDAEIEARDAGKRKVEIAKASLDAAWVKYRADMEKELFEALLHEPKEFNGNISPHIIEFRHPSWMAHYIEWLKAKVELADSVINPFEADNP